MFTKQNGVKVLDKVVGAWNALQGTVDPVTAMIDVLRGKNESEKVDKLLDDAQFALKAHDEVSKAKNKVSAALNLIAKEREKNIKVREDLQNKIEVEATVTGMAKNVENAFKKQMDEIERREEALERKQEALAHAAKQAHNSAEVQAVVKAAETMAQNNNVILNAIGQVGAQLFSHYNQASSEMHPVGTAGSTIEEIADISLPTTPRAKTPTVLELVNKYAVQMPGGGLSPLHISHPSKKGRGDNPFKPDKRTKTNRGDWSVPGEYVEDEE